MEFVERLLWGIVLDIPSIVVQVIGLVLAFMALERARKPAIFMIIAFGLLLGLRFFYPLVQFLMYDVLEIYDEWLQKALWFLLDALPAAAYLLIVLAFRQLLLPGMAGAGRAPHAGMAPPAVGAWEHQPPPAAAGPPPGGMPGPPPPGSPPPPTPPAGTPPTGWAAGPPPGPEAYAPPPPQAAPPNFGHPAQAPGHGPPGYGAPVAGLAEAPARPISKGFFLGSILGGLGIAVLASMGAIAAFAEWEEDLGAVLLLFALVSLLYGAIVLMVFVYRMWAALPPYSGRTTPGAAVGLMFVPLYNMYWVFQVYLGWTQDYNRMAYAEDAPLPRMPEGLAMTLCIMTLLSMIPYIGMLFSLVNLVLMPIFVAKACDGINALAWHASGGQPVRTY